jgi:pimeloyl-ACP methyl ester carboxylesterase
VPPSPTITAPDGATVAYDVQGDGPDLVLVHGITESRRAWDPLLPRLTGSWRVVRVDLRGHGDSERRPPYAPATMAGDVRAVVDALGLDPPLLVGHSMGGVVVSLYAGLGHPARAVVDVDQPLELTGFQDLVAGIRPMLEGDEASFRAAMDLVFGALDGPLPASERTRLGELAQPEQDVVLGVWSGVLDLPAAELDALVDAGLAGIDVPFLSLHGIDPGPGYADWLRARVSGALVEVWPDHGHYPHLIDPGRFVARLAAFDPAH